MGCRRLCTHDALARRCNRRRLQGRRKGRTRSVAPAQDRRPGIVTTVAAGATYAPDAVSAPDDIQASPLWNKDLAPTPLSRRTWSTYNIATLWIGFRVVITTYTLASG